MMQHPPSRTFALIALLLLAVSLHNLLRWRAESRELEAYLERYNASHCGLIIDLRGKLPGIDKMNLDNARLSLEVSVLQAQNRILRDRVRRRFGTQRLAAVERDSARIDGLGPQPSPRAW